MRIATALSLVLLWLTASTSFGWGAGGHRIVTLVALDGLPPEAPAFLRDPVVRQRIAFQSSEPDRWRGNDSLILAHENKLDHYLDVELLDQFGLTLETVPHLRNEYLRAMMIAKHEHPEKIEPYDASKDPDRTKEWPGAALHSIAEHYAKLQSAFNTMRMLEEIGDSSRDFQLVQARENVIYHMGILSHFVGDCAQPLHTTKHFNGWVGDNPGKYTTSNKFHAYIDTGALEHHKLTYEIIKAAAKFDAKVKAEDPWDDVSVYVRRSLSKVEPVYMLERDGKLDDDEGRQFIIERLSDGASMLSAMYWAAYRSAAPTKVQIANFQKYDERASAGGDKAPAAPGASGDPATPAPKPQQP
ncbi:S1/P1 Nuclease [Phycisphaerae bacterium RAS1]|nr:S1/P1 Nuclease [Phycisphaerae bacterium RAS1]